MLANKFPLQLILLIIFITIPLVGRANPSEEIAEAREKKSAFFGGLDLSQNEFSSITSIGLSYSTGNTNSLVLNGESVTKYRYRRIQNKWSLGARYERVFSSNAGASIGTNAHYIYGIYRMDYYLKPYLSLFWGGGVYTNRIKGIDVAGEGFGGVQFLFLNTEETVLSFSLGYDYLYEDRLREANKEIHSALQELNFEQKITDTVKFTQDVKVLENVQNGRDVKVNSKTAFNVKLNDHLSLILAFKVLFDNRPVSGFKKLDTYTDFSLGITF
jgi:putative salt-induced outer membrane protein YdiY